MPRSVRRRSLGGHVHARRIALPCGMRGRAALQASRTTAGRCNPKPPSKRVPTRPAPSAVCRSRCRNADADPNIGRNQPLGRGNGLALLAPHADESSTGECRIHPHRAPGRGVHHRRARCDRDPPVREPSGQGLRGADHGGRAECGHGRGSVLRPRRHVHDRRLRGSAGDEGIGRRAVHDAGPEQRPLFEVQAFHAGAAKTCRWNSSNVPSLSCS